MPASFFSISVSWGDRNLRRLHEERSQRDNLVIIIPAIKKQPEERKHKLATMDAN